VFVRSERDHGAPRRLLVAAQNWDAGLIQEPNSSSEAGRSTRSA
jgi:hypothetical protein